MIYSSQSTNKRPEKYRIIRKLATAPRLLCYLFHRLLSIIATPFLLIDRSFFEGKKIILIGPVKTDSDELTNLSLDDYDLVIRMNRSIDTSLPINSHSKRIDVLFHNLKEQGERRAGIITKN